MIAVKDAVAKVKEFAEEVLEPGQVRNLRLEEVDIETVEGDDFWRITFSMPVPLEPRFAPVRDRDYKVFTIDSRTGVVHSMKIRELAGSPH